MSKTLTQVRQYADRCNKTYVVEKKKSSPKRPTPALHIPNRQTFIPDIGESVPGMPRRRGGIQRSETKTELSAQSNSGSQKEEEEEANRAYVAASLRR